MATLTEAQKQAIVDFRAKFKTAVPKAADQHERPINKPLTAEEVAHLRKLGEELEIALMYRC